MSAAVDYTPPPNARVFVLDVAHAQRWMQNGNEPKVWRDSNRHFGGHHVTHFRWAPLDEIAPQAVWKDVKLARVLADIDAGKPLRALDVVFGEDVVGPPKKLVLTDGIHRLAAARMRGLTHVPVLVRIWIPVKRRTKSPARQQVGSAGGTVAETSKTGDNRGMRAKKTKSAAVPVLFRIEGWKGDVVAVFPTMAERPGVVTCYAHIGQHGSCDRAWYVTTRAAKPDEYRALKSELESIGYDLRVMKRWSA